VDRELAINLIMLEISPLLVDFTSVVRICLFSLNLEETSRAQAAELRVVMAVTLAQNLSEYPVAAVWLMTEMHFTPPKHKKARTCPSLEAK
jgi:hypothetical protein